MKCENSEGSLRKKLPDVGLNESLLFRKRIEILTFHQSFTSFLFLLNASFLMPKNVTVMTENLFRGLL